jgi:hypothetical protein
MRALPGEAAAGMWQPRPAAPRAHAPMVGRAQDIRMGEICPPRAFPRDGPVPSLCRTGVLAPPSGPATEKPISVRKSRFPPTLFNTSRPIMRVLCASDLPIDDFASYA